MDKIEELVERVVINKYQGGINTYKITERDKEDYIELSEIDVDCGTVMFINYDEDYPVRSFLVSSVKDIVFSRESYKLLFVSGQYMTMTPIR